MGEQLHEQLARLGRPWVVDGGRMFGQPGERTVVDVGAHPRRLGGQTERQQFIVERCRVGQAGRAVVDDDAGRHGGATEPATSPAAAAAQHLVPGGVTDPRDRPGGRGDISHQDVGVAIPERGGDLVLLLEAQPIDGPAQDPVQLHPRREHDVVARAEPISADFEQPGLSHLGPAERVDIAQTTAALLEVGLQHEGDLAGFGVTTFDHLAELDQPPFAILRPLRPR